MSSFTLDVVSPCDASHVLHIPIPVENTIVLSILSPVIRSFIKHNQNKNFDLTMFPLEDVTTLLREINVDKEKIHENYNLLRLIKFLEITRNTAYFNEMLFPLDRCIRENEAQLRDKLYQSVTTNDLIELDLGQKWNHKVYFSDQQTLHPNISDAEKIAIKSKFLSIPTSVYIVQNKQAADEILHSTDNLLYTVVHSKDKGFRYVNVDQFDPLATTASKHLKDHLLPLSDWTDIVVAGGRVTAAFTEGEWGDVDYFITTTDPVRFRSANNRIVDAIYQKADRFHKDWFSSNENEQVNIVMDSITPFAITYLTQCAHPDYRSQRYQIIQQKYNCISDVLCGFDVDCCCVAWNGQDIYCLPRFKKALISRYNVVDPQRQHYYYGNRLAKYMNRGFGIAIPGVSPKNSIDFSANSSGLKKCLYQIDRTLDPYQSKTVNSYGADHCVSTNDDWYKGIRLSTKFNESK